MHVVSGASQYESCMTPGSPKGPGGSASPECPGKPAGPGGPGGPGEQEGLKGVHWHQAGKPSKLWRFFLRTDLRRQAVVFLLSSVDATSFAKGRREDFLMGQEGWGQSNLDVHELMPGSVGVDAEDLHGIESLGASRFKLRIQLRAGDKNDSDGSRGTQGGSSNESGFDHSATTAVRVIALLYPEGWQR